LEEIIFTIRQIAIITATAIGSYTDYKTGYIYNWITYPLIIIGIILNIYEQQYTGLAIGIIVYAIGWLSYITGKLGGGDVKIYTGIALTMPFYNGTPFIIPTILFSSLIGLTIISLYYIIKYAKKGIDYKLNKDGIKKAIILTAILALYFIILIKTKIISQTLIFIITIPMICGTLYLAFEKGIKKEFFLTKIKIEQAEEDEIIAIEYIDKKTKEKIKNIKPLMQKDEIEKLKEKGIKEIPVYRNLPRFGPFIFIGTITSILYPNPFL
jgi:Flp pilus assembly protein protease CpaA